MPPAAPPDGTDNVSRNRANRPADSMKLLRMRVPDLSLPGFREEARRQAALLRKAPEQSDALDVIEANADLSDWTK